MNIRAKYSISHSHVSGPYTRHSNLEITLVYNIVFGYLLCQQNCAQQHLQKLLC